MFKIAGELSPLVMHVAARAIATHALSIFGDHSDVMAARTTGFAMLCAASVQEAHDFALIAHAATLRDARAVPALLRRLPHLARGEPHRAARRRRPRRADRRSGDPRASRAPPHARRARAARLGAEPRRLLPGARGRATRSTPRCPRSSPTCFAELAARTGRRYGLVDYTGAPDAERVIVLMGSGAGAADRSASRRSSARGERVGLLQLRLFRPFPARGAARGAPAERARDRRARSHQGARRRSASRSTRTW